MLGALSKTFFHGLAGSTTLKRAASTYGLRSPRSFARRFIAGETIEEAIDAVREVESRGMRHTLDHLGESVTGRGLAESATDDYLTIIRRVVDAGVGRNVSLKLTQLGLDLDRSLALDNLRRILDQAAAHGFFVRIDMENSPYTDATLDLFERVWTQGYREVGVVLQSALHRSERDLEHVIALGASVRLVKGAYQEPRAIAHQDKADVDAAFVRMMRVLLERGHRPAIATHDAAIIDAAKALAAELDVKPDRYEFQMLYGIRRDLQTSLTSSGYRMRIYVPFGREWFPYFMRRLGERPANVLFVLGNLVRER